MNKNMLPCDFPFFIEVFPHQYVPYFVESAIQKEIDIWEIKVQENLSIPIEKENFLQKDFFLQEKDFLQYAGFYSPLRYLDFQVFDKKENNVGVFKSIFEYQGKWCFRICNAENDEMFVYLSNKKIYENFNINPTEKKLILL